MRKGLTMSRLLLLLAEVIAFALLAVVATSRFGMADAGRITVAYLVAYLVPRIVLERARDTSTTARVILFILTVVLMFVGLSNMVVWSRLDGYSLEMPNLAGDARGYYKWALSHYDGRVTCPHLAFPGFPLIMLNMFRVLGVHVVWPLAMNTMFTLTSVVLTGFLQEPPLCSQPPLKGWLAPVWENQLRSMCLRE